MFWPDIVPSLRGTKPSVCHCEPVQGRRGNLNYPKERDIWVQIRILHETDKAILIDNGMKIWVPKSRIDRIRLSNNTFEIYVQRKHCWIVLRTLFRMFYFNSYGFNF